MVQILAMATITRPYRKECGEVAGRSSRPVAGDNLHAREAVAVKNLA